MTHQVITGEKMPPPLGPYSQAIRAGDFLFVAGQPGVDPKTGAIPEGTFAAEARQAFANLQAVIEAAGESMRSVVKTTVYMSDADDFGTMNELYREFFAVDPPVRATPIVRLPRGLRISVEAVASAVR